MKLLVRAYRDDDNRRKPVLVKFHIALDELKDVVVDARIAGATSVVLEFEQEVERIKEVK